MASSLTTYGNTPSLRAEVNSAVSTDYPPKSSEADGVDEGGGETLAEATYATVCLFKLSLSKAPELPRNERRRKPRERKREEERGREKRK